MLHSVFIIIFVQYKLYQSVSTMVFGLEIRDGFTYAGLYLRGFAVFLVQVKKLRMVPIPSKSNTSFWMFFTILLYTLFPVLQYGLLFPFVK